MKFLALILCCVPSLAFAQWDMGSLEKRVGSLESRVDAIEAKLSGDNLRHCDCPCNTGGVCVCRTGECPNEDCPKSSKADANEPYTVGDRTYYFKPDGSIERCVVAPSKTTATSVTPATSGDCGTYRNQSYQGPGRFAERQRTGHYEYRTQCQGGFCRRVQVWVAD